MNNKYDINYYAQLINDNIDLFVPQCDYSEPVVIDAMKYSLSIGGKRIRPALTFEFCRVCGGDIKKALPFAMAIEMIHTYSLIHDDLPCMDDDDMRRSMPSCHIKYGENYALLAGDALLTLAFEIIANSEVAQSNPKVGLEATKILAKSAGVCGMIGGQVVDLASEGKKISLETLQIMDTLKTGMLIKCAAQLGVLAANASEEKFNCATKYAHNIGHAFQIVDDILDVIGDETILGKATGADELNDKSTYVSLLGLEKSQQYAKDLTMQAVDYLEIFGDEAKFLKDLANDLLTRNK